MSRKESISDQGEPQEPHRVRLPGFLIDQEIGLGKAIKRITYAMRIPPCDGCDQRAATLNRWMRFTP
jgi:hypothetical protein